MTFAALLTEAIERAESVALHGHHEALCLIQPTTGKRISYTLDECRSLMLDLDAPTTN